MLFLSILFAISISQELQEPNWDRDFKHNNVAAELIQKMEGGWKYQKTFVGGVEQPTFEILRVGDSFIIVETEESKLLKDQRSTVFDYGLTTTSGPYFEETWKCVAFDSELNLFKFKWAGGDILRLNDDKDKRTCLVAIKDDRLIMVFRIQKFGKAPVVIEPNKEHQYVFRKK